jgi:hypothetical protein
MNIWIDELWKQKGNMRRKRTAVDLFSNGLWELECIKEW